MFIEHNIITIILLGAYIILRYTDFSIYFTTCRRHLDDYNTGGRLIGIGGDGILIGGSFYAI